MGMKPKEMVILTLDAIRSVKRRVKAAMSDGDTFMVNQLMGDLYALECCLVYEAERLMDEMDADEPKKAA